MLRIGMDTDLVQCISSSLFLVFVLNALLEPHRFLLLRLPSTSQKMCLAHSVLHRASSSTLSRRGTFSNGTVQVHGNFFDLLSGHNVGKKGYKSMSAVQSSQCLTRYTRSVLKVSVPFLDLMASFQRSSGQIHVCVRLGSNTGTQEIAT